MLGLPELMLPLYTSLAISSRATGPGLSGSDTAEEGGGWGDGVVDPERARRGLH